MEHGAAARCPRSRRSALSGDQLRHLRFTCSCASWRAAARVLPRADRAPARRRSLAGQARPARRRALRARARTDARDLPALRERLKADLLAHRRGERVPRSSRRAARRPSASGRRARWSPTRKRRGRAGAARRDRRRGDPRRPRRSSATAVATDDQERFVREFVESAGPRRDRASRQALRTRAARSWLARQGTLEPTGDGAAAAAAAAFAEPRLRAVVLDPAIERATRRRVVAAGVGALGAVADGRQSGAPARRPGSPDAPVRTSRSAYDALVDAESVARACGFAPRRRSVAAEKTELMELAKQLDRCQRGRRSRRTSTRSSWAAWSSTSAARSRTAACGRSSRESPRTWPGAASSARRGEHGNADPRGGDQRHHPRADPGVRAARSRCARPASCCRPATASRASTASTRPRPASCSSSRTASTAWC